MRGMSLVEVLVALVVLSVGLLGIAQVLIHGMRTSHAALLRTQAVNLVADMAESIRANPLGAAAYELAAYDDGPVAHGCAADANCTASELAEDDLARWLELVRAFAAGSGDVRFAGADATHATDRYSITLSWLEPGDSEPLSEHTDIELLRPVAP